MKILTYFSLFLVSINTLITSSMTGLTSLSAYILVSFLNEWLTVKENCVLNTSVSNLHARLKLTNTLRFSCKLVTRPKDSRFTMTLLELEFSSALTGKYKSGSYAVYKSTDDFNSPLEVWNLIINEEMTNLISRFTSPNQLHISPTQTCMEKGICIISFWGKVSGKSQLSVKSEPLNPEETAVESTNSTNNDILARSDVMYTFGIVTASQQFCQETQQNIAVTYNRRNNLQRWGGEMLTYCGKWELNGCHGYGKCTYVDGSTYEGEWSCNLRSGFGTMVYARTFWGADTYMGNWLLNVRHGRGHFSSAFYEYCYDGDWEEGEMYGHGVIEWKTGETMEGLWDGTLTSMQSRRENDLICELRLLNGDVYRGLFLRGFIYGDGSVLYHNGDKFEGAFRMEKQCDFCKTSQMSSLCTCAATTGRWFTRMRLMVGTYTKRGEEEAVWNTTEWEPPKRNKDEEWLAGGIPFKGRFCPKYVYDDDSYDY